MSDPLQEGLVLVFEEQSIGGAKVVEERPSEASPGNLGNSGLKCLQRGIAETTDSNWRSNWRMLGSMNIEIGHCSISCILSVEYQVNKKNNTFGQKHALPPRSRRRSCVQ